MTEREKVIEGLEQFRSDLKPFCGSHADWKRFDAGLVLLKEQQKEIEERTKEAAAYAELLIKYGLI